MGIIRTFDLLDKEIKQVGGRPVVLEALWDGDTNGWYLLLYLHTVTSRFFFLKDRQRHFLGEIGIQEGQEYYTDDKITVALIAEELGRQAAQKYKLTFYFPSKDDEDDDCPSWEERHLGIVCEDCSKLILPRESPYLPKEVCYRCHLKRERNESIRKAEPADDGYNFYLSKDDEYISVGYCTRFEDFAIAPFIQDKVRQRLTEEAVSVISLDLADIQVLKDELEAVLEKLLLTYEKPHIEENMRKFIGTYKIQYREQEYELMDRRNDSHSAIASYVASIKTAEKAITEGYSYQFFFKRGITYRDDAVLRFVNYVCKGVTTISVVQQQYAGQLSAVEVTATLEKLAQIGCITISGQQVSMTKLGICIV